MAISADRLRSRLTFDLRDSWQGRVMAAAEGRMMLMVSSMLAHVYDVEPLIVLFNLVRPRCWDEGRQSLRTPFLCTAGRVDWDGSITAVCIASEGVLPSRMVVFVNMWDFETELRKLADKARLLDADRLEFFACAKKWVVADRRLDPTMDPRDPGAKRLTRSVH